jgi:aryl-alcohol dehydrogenase-like predicted oxidoreductase
MGQPMPANSRGAADSRLTTWVSQFGPSLERFIRYADKRGVSPGHLATAWVRYNPAVTCPIVGVSSLQQLIESFGAFEFDLTADEYDDVSAIFDTEVKEEGFQRFAGYKYNFPRLRRDIHLLD